MSKHISYSREEDRASTKYRKVILVTVILLALIVLMLFLFSQCNAKPEPDDLATPKEPSNVGGVTAGIITQDKVDVGGKDLQTLVNEQVAEGMFRVFISTHITVDAEGNMEPLIQNSGLNKYHCWVELLDEYGTQVYATDVIPPGFKVETDTMTPMAAKGKNECKAVFHLLTGATKDSEEVNSVEIAVDLVQE